jgi:hypothetical protein
MKQGSCPFGQINLYAAGGGLNDATGNVNFSTGTAAFSGTNLINSTFVNVGGGWYRVSLTLNSLNQQTFINRLYLRGSGVAGEFGYFWGAQLEPGITPSAYANTSSGNIVKANNNLFVMGNTYIYSSNSSVSNTTGALVVGGGMGITGNLFMSAANNYSLTTSEDRSYRLGWTDNYFTRSPTYNGIYFSGSFLAIRTGPFYIEGSSSLIARGVITNDTGNNTVIFNAVAPVRLQNTAASTSNTTGSLIVGGGVGVSGNVVSNSFITSTDTSNYLIRLDGFGGSGPKIEFGTPSAPNSFMSVGAYNGFNNIDTGSRNFRIGSPTVTNIMLANAATGVVTFANNVIVSGNLTVIGNVSVENVQSFAVSDPLIQLGIGNYTSDLRDIGFAGHYNDGSNAHTGLIRDSGTKEYYLFQGYTPELGANNNLVITDSSFRLANVYSSYFKGNTGAGMYFPNGTLNTGFTANGKTALILESPQTGSQGNYIRIKGISPLASPSIIAEGGDAHIGLDFYATGTASPTRFYNNAISSPKLQFQINNDGGGVNYLAVSGNTTGGNPTISALGIDTNIGITLRSAGKGAVNVTTTGASSANLNIYGPGEPVSSGLPGAVLNLNSSSGVARLNVIASGSCTRSELVVSSTSVGSEANVIISSTGAFLGGFNTPASQKIYSPYGTAQLQVEGNTATLNVISISGSGNPATLQILCANGGMFGSGVSSLKIASDYAGRSYANVGSSYSQPNQVNIISSLPSTSTTTGALAVQGGVGVTGNVWANSVYVTTSSGAVYTDNLRYAANGQPWVLGSAGGGGASLSGYTANTIVVANSSGYLSNSNSFFTASNSAMFVTGQIYSNNQDVMVTSLMYSVAFG